MARDSDAHPTECTVARCRSRLLALGAALLLACTPLESPERTSVDLGTPQVSTRSSAPAASDASHPDYVTGDECLFCHRNVGQAWSENPHARTMHPAGSSSIGPEPSALVALRVQGGFESTVDDVEFLLGRDRAVRFLKQSEHGRMALLNARWRPAIDRETEGDDGVSDRHRGDIVAGERPQWDEERFQRSCAGCHATAMDQNEDRFADLSLDCYVCHGSVDLEHSNEPALVLLSPRRSDPPRVVNSICASCHARSGRSRRNGRPYPYHFVPGNDLFTDFEIDLSDARLATLSPIERHIAETLRTENTHCLDCHDVHAGSSRKHRQLDPVALCTVCHGSPKPQRIALPVDLHNETCEY